MPQRAPAEPRGLQKASYCMMLAPPAGPAHTQELKLAHGLCAGGGHRKPQPHPAQQQQPQLHADLLEGFPADEMPMLFDQVRLFFFACGCGSMPRNDFLRMTD